MCFLFSFMPATFWVVIGYVVLVLASRAEGRLATFGRLLAIWVFMIAGAILLAGAYVTQADMCSLDALMQCAQQA